jgi:hypothetical protein
MTTKADILRAIRQKCLDCSCHQPSEVRDCPITACDLWPYRFGRDPEPSRTRGFAKPSGYTRDLPDSAGPGTPTAPPSHHSQNPSSTRAVLEDGMLFPPLARSGT